MSNSANHIAIIGMSGRFPGAADVAAFWRILVEGTDAIGHFTATDLEHCNADKLPGVRHVGARGVLDGADEFDAEFFGITPREAELMDPQHRLFLQCSWHALEDAGHDPATFTGLIGVYAGLSLNTYLLYNLQRQSANLAASFQIGAYQTMLGNDKDFMPTRVSYKLGLRGPSMAVQTACSTSLVAVAQACQALLTYQADICLAGGVSISFPQKRDYPYTEDAMASPDGRCRPFDAEAQGTVFGHGVGVVALRRLDDALKDGDHILAVIRGSAVNNDGAGKIGFAAPSVAGQAEVISMAQALGEVDPSTISYVEAHGTGTPLGDPIEMAALAQAFQRGATAPLSCTIGTAKGNIGHLDVAAGVTGLIKTVLQLQHRTIAPVLNFRTPNPRLDLANGGFRIADRLQPWTGPQPLRAGVSAFGVGGTNAHVVVEEAPKREPQSGSRQHQLLLLSARTNDALDQVTARLHAHLTEHDLPLAEVAFTLRSGRRAFNHRRIAVCDNRETALQVLGDSARLPSGTTGAPAGVAFLFPGQGAQHAGMAAGIYRSEPQFRGEVDRLCALANPILGFDLRTALFPDGDLTSAHERLRQTEVAQPALFIVALSLAKLWLAWGVQPQAFIGHSVGEYVGAVLAEVMSETDALRLVALRGRLIQALPAGTMLSVRLSEADLLPRLPAGCSIAAVNGPQLCVASGPADAISTLESRLATDGVVSRPLKTSHAFHSSMMNPVLPQFAEAMASVRLSSPKIPIVSCVTGTWLTPTQATDPRYWVDHVRATVRFADAVATLRRDGALAFLEVGPGRTLTTLARQTVGDDPRALIASLPTPAESAERTQPVSDTATVIEALGRLWLAGINIDWAAFQAHEPGQRVSLPGYPFARTRFWIAPPAQVVTTPTMYSVQASPLPVSSTEGPAPMASAPTPSMPIGVGGRRPALLAALRNLLGELSGTAPERLDPTVSFLELGFDSLLLTQVSMAIQSRIKGKVSFRQLLGDIGSLDALTDHLDRTLPPEAFVSAPTPAPRSVTAPTSTGNESPLEQLIRRQMEMMAEQLAMLKGGLPASAPAAPAPATAAPTALVAKEPEFKAFGPYKPIQRGPSGGLNPQQQAALDRLITRYNAKTAKSKALTQRHRSHLADPRVAAGFRAQWKELVYPIVTMRSKGTRLWDVDGNEYVDILNGFGCIFFGHAPDFVVEAVNQQMAQGYEIGPQTMLAGEAAELMCEMTGLDRTTFCNTGSEAVMAAMRLARTVTGRMRIVSFLGDYHGTFDEVLAKSVGEDHRSLPIAPGIPQGKVDNITVLPYGTDETLAWIRAHADELAAVLVEPVQSRHPALQPKAFVQEIRRITEASGTALIMDEVITGFRTHPGGAQALFGVKADLASYGKVIGGGMPIGVLCGSRRFMDALDGGMWQYGDDSFPEIGVTFFAGTFVRHPATMAAVVACLKHLKQEGAALQAKVDAKCTRLVGRLNTLFKQRGVPTTIEHFSSYFYFTFAPEHRHGSLLYYLLRERGVHIQEGFPCFLTTAHTDEDLDFVYQGFSGAVDELVTNGFFPEPSGRVNEHERDQSLANATTTTASPTTNVKTDVVALSASQHEVWLAARFSEQASCAYNESVTIHLGGRLDAPTLQRAWAAVVARHEALRAQFSEDGATQRFVADRRIPLHDVDWRSLAADERDRRLVSFLRQEAETAFDLVQGPVVRATLIALSTDDHALVITAHHLVCDGWSMNVVCDELGRLYSALHARLPVDLTATPGFGTYLRWQEQQRGSQEAESSTTHWRQRFAKPPALPDLPTDHQRPGQRTFNGDTVRHRLSQDLHRALKRLSAQHKATLFTTLLSAFQTLILRLSGQDDVVVGVPVAGQPQLDQDGDFLVGHCVNFLPLRARISGDRSLTEQLPELQKAVLNDFGHQHYTYGSLLNDLTLARDPSRLPLTEVQFNLERWVSTLRFGDLAVRFDSNPKRFVIFDLFINAVEMDDGVVLVCDYNRTLFDATTIQRWLGHYESLLTGLVAKPTSTVEHLPLLSPADRQTLERFNATAVSWSGPALVHRLIEEQASRTPGAIALSFDDQTLDYRHFNERANQLAHLLRAAGVGPGSLVAVCAERCLELPIALVAILKAGGGYVPVDPALPAERIAFMLAEAAAPVVLTQSHLIGILPSPHGRLIRLDGDAALIAKEATTNLDGGVGPDDPAYVIYTSGSTGRPKGAINAHRGIVNCLQWMQQTFRLTNTDRMLLKTTFSFDVSVTEFFWPLMIGARLDIAPPEIQYDSAAMARHIADHGITVVNFVPSLLHLFLSEPAASACTALRIVIAAGEALPGEMQERFFSRLPWCALHNLYGPTEAAVYATAWECRPGELLAGGVSIGQPLANTRIHILDAHGQVQPVGLPGELHIGGIAVCRGYLARAELTAERFIPDPFSTDPTARLYRTGDLARWHTKGQIEYLGRMDHQVKIRGLRIELGEIEALLASHPEVREAVVVPHGTSEHRSLVGYVVLKQDNDDVLMSVRQYLGEKLPAYMIPSVVMRLSALPLTPNGKIDRKALPPPTGLAPSSLSAEDDAVPHLAIYFQLIQLFEDVLGVRRVRLNDDFFALGGNSLLAFKLMSDVEQMTGRRLGLSTLFKHSTPRRLAKEILRGDQQSKRQLMPVQVGEHDHPPFFFLHGDLLGGGYYCVSLARRLGSRFPFFTLAPRVLDQTKVPVSISELAGEIVQEIVSAYPEGPCHIGGFCIGGMIAHEVACQLEQRGRTVLQLTLVDAQIDFAHERLNRTLVRGWSVIRRLPIKQQIELFGRLNQRRERLREIQALPFAEQWRYLLSKLGLRANPVNHTAAQSSRLHAIVLGPDSEAQISLYQWSVCVHRPQKIAAPILLFVSDEMNAVNRDPTLEWKRLTSQVTTNRIPGLHLETVTRNLPHLVNLLLPLLKERHPESAVTVAATR